MTLPRQPEINCFKCKFYRPDETRQYQGNCCKNAPQARSETGTGEPGMEWCFIPEPAIVWCGDFEKWTGPAREEGTYCPPVEVLNAEASPAVMTAEATAKADTTAEAVKAEAAPAAEPAAEPAAAKTTTKKTTTKKK